MFKRILFAILAVIFVFIASVYMSMGNNTIGGAAILIALNFVYWALRKQK